MMEIDIGINEKDRAAIAEGSCARSNVLWAAHSIVADRRWARHRSSAGKRA
jgi:hypothetical protein